MCDRNKILYRNLFCSNNYAYTELTTNWLIWLESSLILESCRIRSLCEKLKSSTRNVGSPSLRSRLITLVFSVQPAEATTIENTHKAILFTYINLKNNQHAYTQNPSMKGESEWVPSSFWCYARGRKKIECSSTSHCCCHKDFCKRDTIENQFRELRILRNILEMAVSYVDLSRETIISQILPL